MAKFIIAHVRKVPFTTVGGTTLMFMNGMTFVRLNER